MTQIISINFDGTSGFTVRFDGEAEDCFTALICVAVHFAKACKISPVEVCQKLLETAKAQPDTIVDCDRVH